MYVGVCVRHNLVALAAQTICGMPRAESGELLAFVRPANRLGNCCAAVKCNLYIRTRSMAVIKPTHTHYNNTIEHKKRSNKRATTNKRKLNVNHKNVNEEPLIKLRVFRCYTHTRTRTHSHIGRGTVRTAC